MDWKFRPARAKFRANRQGEVHGRGLYTRRMLDARTASAGLGATLRPLTFADAICEVHLVDANGRREFALSAARQRCEVGLEVHALCVLHTSHEA